jgi:SAM-dependent methyltransferase
MTTFDTLAPQYDVDFSERPTAQTLRAAVHDRLRLHLSAGASVLEIGCGTGIDAEFMASLGAHVTATDSSAGMLEQARARVGSGVMFDRLDINALPLDGFGGAYRLVLADFGVLNACRDFSALAAWLSTRVEVGGMVCMAVMSRFCWWETAWNMLHLQPRRASRRWRGQADFIPPDGGQPMTVFYPSMGEVERAFEPWFDVSIRRGLGVALPPSEMFGVVESRWWLVTPLTRLEGFLWRRGWGYWLADHVWWEMVRWRN